MRLTTIALSASAATVALALVAAPASALNVDYASGDPVTGTAKGDTVMTANGQAWTCADSSLSGHVNAGTTNPAANITSASWTTCDFVGMDVFVTVTGPNWSLNAVSGMTSGTSDSISGTITNISNISVLIDGPFGDCTFEVSGSVSATFNENNGKGGQSIVVSPTNSNLTITNVDNGFTCLGLVNEDDAATFSGEYNLDTTAGEINIRP